MQEYVCACTYVHVCCMAKLWDERTNSHLMVHKSIFDNSRGSSINMWLQTQRAGTWAPGAGKGLLWEQGQEEAEGPGQWTLILQDSGYIFDCKICTYITVGGGGGKRPPTMILKFPCGQFSAFVFGEMDTYYITLQNTAHCHANEDIK